MADLLADVVDARRHGSKNSKLAETRIHFVRVRPLLLPHHFGHAEARPSDAGAGDPYGALDTV